MSDILKDTIMVLKEKFPTHTEVDISEATVLKTDLGLDSLRIVDLMVSLEERFNIAFDESDLNPRSLQNVADLVDIVEKTMTGGEY